MEEPPDDEDYQSISFDHDAGELEDLEGLPQVGYYFENIFGLKEFYLYRAVTYIHLKKFTEAIADFNALRKFQDKDPLSSMTLKSDISQNEFAKACSITERETIYNIILCYVAMGERDKCQKALDALIKLSSGS